MEAVLTEIQDRLWEIHGLSKKGKATRKQIRQSLNDLWEWIDSEMDESYKNEFIQSVMEVK
jgi:predicted transcriptional regulator